jgi:Protein of unknown function (DUF3043)
VAKPTPNSHSTPVAADGSGTELNSDGTPVGKGRPTPKRKEREAANLRPLVGSDRKLANKEARAKYNEARDRARIGMAAGEEKFLPARDKGPQRRFVRDYVDARFSVGELMIPVMLVIIVLTLVDDYQIQIISILALWGFFILAVLDCVLAGVLVGRKLAAKFGKEHVQKGYRWYAAMRCLQLRPMRLPKPQVKRGQYPA